MLELDWTPPRSHKEKILAFVQKDRHFYEEKKKLNGFSDIILSL